MKTPAPHLMILDDDHSLNKSLTEEFRERGYTVSAIPSLKLLKENMEQMPSIDYALVDLRLNGEYGLDAIEILLQHSPRARIVILSGYRSIASAVDAIRRGAVDYILKPANTSAIEAALQGLPREPTDELERPSLSDIESEYINFVLTKNDGNISRTARDLGLHRQSLQRKLKKYT